MRCRVEGIYRLIDAASLSLWPLLSTCSRPHSTPQIIHKKLQNSIIIAKHIYIYIYITKTKDGIIHYYCICISLMKNIFKYKNKKRKICGYLSMAWTQIWGTRPRRSQPHSNFKNNNNSNIKAKKAKHQDWIQSKSHSHYWEMQFRFRTLQM